MSTSTRSVIHWIPRSALLPFLLVLLSSPSFGAACPHLRQLQEGWNEGGSPGELIQQLFDHHLAITREVTRNLDDGTITTYTRSNDPAVAQLLRQHVTMMVDRVQNNLPVRPWDDFFAELFARRAEYSLQLPDPQPSDGVRAVLSATTACGRALIEDHTAVVTLFVGAGRAEGSKSHSVPPDCLVAGGDDDDDDSGAPGADWFTFLNLFLEWLSSLFAF